MPELTYGRDAIDEPILIRYDGLDAGRHEIEMQSLATSMQGLSRIISVVGNFAATQNFVQHQDAMSVRVVVRPPEAHCFEILAFVKWAASHPLIATTVGGLSVVLISYVFKRAAGQREEMKHLRGALDTAIRELGTRDQAVIDRLLDTVDKMADSLRPAAKKAVEPIGRTASTLSIGSVDRTRQVVLGSAEKDAITAKSDPEILPEQTYEVLISELDWEKGGCLLSLAPYESPSRIAGTITDPLVMNSNSPYAIAFAAKRPMRVRAKASIRDGAIERLFISDTAEPDERNETAASPA